MKDDAQRGSLTLGVFGRRASGGMSGLTGPELVALSLSALWLIAVTVFFAVAGGPDDSVPRDPLRGLTVAVVVFMPVALIWVATLVSNSTRAMRAEAERLQQALDAMRQAYVAQNQAAGTAIKPSVEKKIDALVAAQRETGAALATFSTIRQPSSGGDQSDRQLGEPEVVRAEPEMQPSLDLPPRGNEGGGPVSIPDFIAALNFPETPEDTEGFRALRRAMQDRRAAELVQASQDVLTLLSQEGVYMDDLTPDRARPELWRRFAEGERGRAISGLGGIRDRSGIALTASRMRQDHVFRDTAHHFLRKFDHVFAEFEKQATDADIAALADTRTARAFMLIGRVAGTFD